MSIRLPSAHTVREDTAPSSATLTRAAWVLDGAGDYVLSYSGVSAAEFEVDGAGDLVLTPVAALTPGSTRRYLLTSGPGGGFALH